MHNENEQSFCPIKDTLDFINRKWVLCILMDMFTGLSHFNEFKEANPEISNNVLSQTLKFMESSSLIIKKTENNGTEYVISDRGLKFNTLLWDMIQFSFSELNGSKFDDDIKNKMLSEYKRLLNI